MNGLKVENEKLRGLLQEARTTFEMWKDVAPAISLCADIDAALSQQAEPAPAQDEREAFEVAHALRALAEQFKAAWPEHDGKYDFLVGAGSRIARATRPVQTEQQPVVPTLTPAELEDLREFHEAVCCDAGHRVEKQGMRRLAEIGAVESVGFGKHRLTEFGIYLLAALSTQGDKP